MLTIMMELPSGQFNTDFEDQKNLGIGFSKDGYTGNINTDFENTNARVAKTIDKILLDSKEI